METMVKRVDGYDDGRFSRKVLLQHGAFVVNGTLAYEVEILSETLAQIRGDARYFMEVIEAFRFYAQHITRFLDGQGCVVADFSPVQTFAVNLADIQPSQFLVDIDKQQAVSQFVTGWEDVVIPLSPFGERFVSQDGHTRLSVAVQRGFNQVRGYLVDGDEDLYAFAQAAKERGVVTPYDLKAVPHRQYIEEWDGFCDAFFARK